MQARTEAGLAELSALHATLSRRHAQLVEPAALGLVAARDVRAGEVRLIGGKTNSQDTSLLGRGVRVSAGLPARKTAGCRASTRMWWNSPKPSNMSAMTQCA